jgi:hypothetical protein
MQQVYHYHYHYGILKNVTSYHLTLTSVSTGVRQNRFFFGVSANSDLRGSLIEEYAEMFWPKTGKWQKQQLLEPVHSLMLCYAKGRNVENCCAKLANASPLLCTCRTMMLHETDSSNVRNIITNKSYKLCSFGVYAAMGLQNFIILGQHSING